jgi:hypothetical protein
MFINEKTSRSDLEVIILDNDELYKSFDENKLLNGLYTTQELLDKITEWIESGNEAI